MQTYPMYLLSSFTTLLTFYYRQSNKRKHVCDWDWTTINKPQLNFNFCWCMCFNSCTTQSTHIAWFPYLVASTRIEWVRVSTVFVIMADTYIDTVWFSKSIRSMSSLFTESHFVNNFLTHCSILLLFSYYYVDAESKIIRIKNTPHWVKWMLRFWDVFKYRHSSIEHSAFWYNGNVLNSCNRIVEYLLMWGDHQPAMPKEYNKTASCYELKTLKSRW